MSQAELRITCLKLPRGQHQGLRWEEAERTDLRAAIRTAFQSDTRAEALITAADDPAHYLTEFVRRLSAPRLPVRITPGGMSDRHVQVRGASAVIDVLVSIVEAVTAGNGPAVEVELCEAKDSLGVRLRNLPPGFTEKLRGSRLQLYRWTVESVGGRIEIEDAGTPSLLVALPRARAGDPN